MYRYYHPGAQQASHDSVTWVFRDSSAHWQLCAVIILAGLALWGWVEARNARKALDE